MEIGYAFLEFRPWVLSEGRAALHLLVQAFLMPALSRRDRSDSLRERNGHHTAEQEVWVVAKLAMVTRLRDKCCQPRHDGLASIVL